jgi:hypothetical protein
MPKFRLCDHGNSAPSEVGRQLWQSIGSIIGPAIFDRHVLAIDKARLLQALVERAQLIPGRMNRCRVEEPHHRHRRLLTGKASAAAESGRTVLATEAATAVPAIKNIRR